MVAVDKVNGKELLHLIGKQVGKILGKYHEDKLSVSISSDVFGKIVLFYHDHDGALENVDDPKCVLPGVALKIKNREVIFCAEAKSEYNIRYSCKINGGEFPLEELKEIYTILCAS